MQSNPDLIQAALIRDWRLHEMTFGTIIERAMLRFVSLNPSLTNKMLQQNFDCLVYLSRLFHRTGTSRRTNYLVCIKYIRKLAAKLGYLTVTLY